LLHRRIKFYPRRPSLPFLEFVHLREYNLRRSADGGRPRDVEFGGLQRNDDNEDDNDYRNNGEDFFEHRFSPVDAVTCRTFTSRFGAVR